MQFIPTTAPASDLHGQSDRSGEGMPDTNLEEAFCGAVTVGERGQVVIPADARDRLGILPGDRMLVFRHPAGDGVAFIKVQALQRMSEALAPFLHGDAIAAEPAEGAAVAAEGDEQ
jgi:AbrB family looped-hinge helix DNA binding protein